MRSPLLVCAPVLLMLSSFAWGSDPALCRVMSHAKEREHCLSRYEKTHFDRQQAKQIQAQQHKQKAEQWRQQQIQASARLMQPDPTLGTPLVTRNNFGIIHFQIYNIRVRSYIICTTYDVFDTVLSQERLLIKPHINDYSLQTSPHFFPAYVSCKQS